MSDEELHRWLANADINGLQFREIATVIRRLQRRVALLEFGHRQIAALDDSPQMMKELAAKALHYSDLARHRVVGLEEMN